MKAAPSELAIRPDDTVPVPEWATVPTIVPGVAPEGGLPSRISGYEAGTKGADRRAFMPKPQL